jgi:hypothetical protein
VSYEGLRDSSGGSFTGTMPTAAERTGDFSQTKDANGNLIVIYDPSTTRLDPTKYRSVNAAQPDRRETPVVLSDAEPTRRRPEQHEQLFLERAWD